MYRTNNNKKNLMQSNLSNLSFTSNVLRKNKSMGATHKQIVIWQK